MTLMCYNYNTYITKEGIKMPLFKKNQKSPSVPTNNRETKAETETKEMSDSQLLEHFTSLLFDCASNLMIWETQNRKLRETPTGKATHLKFRAVNDTFRAIKDQINSAEGCSPQQLTNLLLEMV